jgi:hypothetical protein
MAHCPRKNHIDPRPRRRCPWAVDVAWKSRHGGVTSCCPLPFGVGRSRKEELHGRVMHRHSWVRTTKAVLCDAAARHGRSRMRHGWIVMKLHACAHDRCHPSLHLACDRPLVPCLNLIGVCAQKNASCFFSYPRQGPVFIPLPTWYTSFAAAFQSSSTGCCLCPRRLRQSCCP